MDSRLPRFKRASTIAPMQLTERDREIIQLIHRHRFLRSPQIVALIGGSSQHLLRRLQLLYHHGYLERPRSQIDYYHQHGSRPIVYGLGDKGSALLKEELGGAFRELSWGEKNRAAGRMFLEHALLVSDVMVTIELACRTRGIRLITEKEVALPGKCQPFYWTVNISSRLRLGVIPDRVFAIEYPDASGASQRAYFFLEADRGTMPVTRRTLFQTSFYRKLLAYETTWTQSLHRTRFGLPTGPFCRTISFPRYGRPVSRAKPAVCWIRLLAANGKSSPLVGFNGSGRIVFGCGSTSEPPLVHHNPITIGEVTCPNQSSLTSKP